MRSMRRRIRGFLEENWNKNKTKTVLANAEIAGDIVAPAIVAGGTNNYVILTAFVIANGVKLGMDIASYYRSIPPHNFYSKLPVELIGKGVSKLVGYKSQEK